MTLNECLRKSRWTHRLFTAFALVVAGSGWPAASEAINTPDLMDIVRDVARQPFVSQTRRLIEALDFAGSPLPTADLDALDAAMRHGNDAEAVERIQRLLNSHTLIDVHINAEARVKVARGECSAVLQEQGWKTFLVRVHNEPRVAARLAVNSRNSQPTIDPSRIGTIGPEDVRERWLSVEMVDKRPLNPRLSGLPVEYRIVTIFSRDAGDREGHFAFDIGHGTQDIGFRNDLHILFNCLPAVEVVFNIQDSDGTPTTGSLVIRDEKGQLYPLPARRLAPDFFFQEQVYRASGESVMLPAGRYTVIYGRGPEYRRKTLNLDVPDGKTHTVDLQLARWIDPGAKGWTSGDHHIHAAGCMHYDSPTIGVSPPVMMRHLEGEALSIGNVLSWGHAWKHQKKYFTGAADAVSTDRNVLRYDVEVSQFPSDPTGHLCLLGLTEDDYPGASGQSDWPSWGLPILQWAKSQGAVVGVAHSGWGLDVFPEKRVPNYVIPPMDGIGAQEAIVDAVHDAVDFLGIVDTPYVWELNVWYHLMNCGFDIKTAGETDFPCIYGERVGLGRSYVKLDNSAPLKYPDWLEGLRAGRSYVSGGMSHLMDFSVDGLTPGDRVGSILKLDGPQTVHVTATAAAWLDEEPRTVFLGAENWDTLLDEKALEWDREQIPIRDLPYTVRPYWHIERARIGDSRNVSVELIVNGQPAGRVEIPADGSEVPISFDVEIERSSWIALRILAASHTNAVTVEVGGQPVRASKLSAEWCLDSIDQVWIQKAGNIRPRERAAAREAFDAARQAYRKIAGDSYDDTAILARADADLRRWQQLDIRENLDLLEYKLARDKTGAGTVTFDRALRGFTGEILLRMSVKPEVATIHYTVDGTQVTMNSPVYDGAITLNKTTAVSARGFIDGKACTDRLTAIYTQFSAEEYGVNASPGQVRSGLNYRYYEGEFREWDDVAESALLTEYITPNFTLDPRERDLNYALQFSGFIDIPQDGAYTFRTSSDDGTLLYVDDTLVVKNDGIHGVRPAATGSIRLKAGLHPIRLNYFNAIGGWGLEVTWKGPTFQEQLIPDEVFYRIPLFALERQSAR